MATSHLNATASTSEAASSGLVVGSPPFGDWWFGSHFWHPATKVNWRRFWCEVRENEVWESEVRESEVRESEVCESDVWESEVWESEVWE